MATTQQRTAEPQDMQLANLRNPDTILLLIGLQQTADRPSGGTERGIEHVHIALLPIAQLLLPVADLHGAGLVVRAVAAADQLAIGIVAWEPALQVVFAGGSVVQRAGDDVDYLKGRRVRGG